MGSTGLDERGPSLLSLEEFRRGKCQKRGHGDFVEKGKE